MGSFVVHGPFRIPFEKRKGGRFLLFDDFWSEELKQYELRNEVGCYVFAISVSGSLKPLYVGKTLNSFKQETFNVSNQSKFLKGFSEYAKGKPVMFFVVHPAQKGKTNEKQIIEIEDFLIQTGVAKNPNLLNKIGTNKPKWCIKGVIRDNYGKKADSVRKFRKLFDINE
jgi:hypothetical protein